MSYKIFTGAALREMAATQVGGTNIFMPEGKRYWVDYVVKDHSPELKSEMHDAETDIYIVMQGEGEIALGGTLIAPTSPRAGQHRGDGLDGAETYHLQEGDVVIIPEGVPHMVDTRDSRMVWMVVKVAGGA
ncbi:MAG: Cupin domain protein [bacterium ADurb.Bin429]|nr:MAG: Cupin domain protein [bacterium ADurb.Bin429]